MNRQAAIEAIKPLGFWKSLLFFGIPMIIMRGFYYLVMALLDHIGFRLFFTFLIGFGVPSFLMLFFTWLFWKGEKSGSFRERFRLQRLNANGLLWTIVLSAIWILAPILMRPATEWVQSNWFSPDKLWVRLMTPDPNYLMEIAIEGNWWIYLAMAGFILLNVFGGELYFRGYIFPRQELSFGNQTFLYHALFWTFFRSFLPWELATTIVIAFAHSYVVQRTKNTWTAIFAHAIGLCAAFMRAT
jgi:membrane protease YdiL (CAAX protease family)